MDTIRFRMLTICALLLISTAQGTPGHWWSLAREKDIKKLTRGKTSVCDDINGLSRNQNSLCKKYHSHMQFVSQGAHNGINECQHQFSDHRWNCSTVNDTSVFGNVLGIGSKEIAFTYAVASAGVVHAVTRACKMGTIEKCGCSEKPRPKGLHPDWNWKGCGDDTNYAYGFAKEFVDALERDNLSPRGRKAKARKAMNLHNNEAGRMTVVRSARPACKCHGVSGSCNMKTCWYQVPDFRTIGKTLRRAHMNAVEMRMTRKGQIKVRRPGRRAPKPSLTDLVYIESSPDYCRKNIRTGVPGTRGRECNRDSRGSDGCGLLCCGRGYRTETVVMEVDCHCKFQWCCTVKCEKCNEHITKYICE